MRIVLFWSYYEGYVDRLYARNPGLRNASYTEQRNAIISDYFGWPPSVVLRMAEQGHTVDVIVVNAEHLQRTWASENGVAFDEADWQRSLPLAQVRRFQPDVVWIGSMFRYYGEYLGTLKPLCKLLVAWIACPMPPFLDLSHIDLILTHNSDMADNFRKVGKNSEQMFPAFEPRILDGMGEGGATVPVSFVGNLTWTHSRRVDFMRAIVERTPLEMWTEKPHYSWRSMLRPQFLPVYLKSRKLWSRSHPAVFGMDMYRVLARSVMTVNVHGEGPAGRYGNMRTFEATGAGTLLLTESDRNLTRIFEPDKEVVAYTGLADLIGKIEGFLSQPQECARMAKAGQERVLRDHNTVLRARQLAAMLQDRLRSAAG